jgi:hypothetical protein
MNSKLLAICSQCVAIFICANAPTVIAAQTNSSVADFGDLVKSFLIPASAVPSWNLGAHPAVRWESPTPKPAGTDLAKDGLPMSRTGVVQISHSSDTSQSSQWDVTLAGSRTSPLETSLSMDKQGESGIYPPDDLKAAGFKLKALCEPGGISSGTALYEISAAGYRPAVLAHEWSSGSAGTWMALTFAYTKQRAAKLKCE